MNLYLVPASHENLKTTMLISVRSSRVEQILRDEGKLAQVKAILGEHESFNCWATTEADRATYDSMTRGDCVLFAVNNTPDFRHSAQIVGKVESERVGELLWPSVKNLPWSLIYFVGGMRHINVPKRVVLEKLGYSPADAANISRIQQIRRVASPHLSFVSRQFNAIPGFLDWLADYEKGLE